MGDVKELLNSKIFAIVGVSRESQKVGHIIFKNLLGSGKKVFGVNPNADIILGEKIFNDLLEIPYKIDCVIIATPIKTIPLILRHAGRLKIPNAVVVSAGFSEAGNKNAEEYILKICKEENIRLLGPNSFGFIDAHNNINTTFFQGKIKKGKISFISQSGAIGSAILDSINSLSGFVGVGNSADFDFGDFIDFYSKDKNTEIICIYMESIKEGKGLKFIEACKRCSKPIFVLKAGKSKAGQKAAKSHTAALATNANVYSGIFRQAGAIEVNSIEELFGVAKVYEKYKKIGKRALIITNAGGLGVLTTDYCEENNIHISELPDKIKGKLNDILPKFWSHNNPIDVIGDATSERYEAVLKLLDKESFFDYFIVLLTPQFMSEPLKTAELLLKIQKPVFACFLGGQQVEKAKEFMKHSNIINFEEPKVCVRF